MRHTTIASVISLLLVGGVAAAEPGRGRTIRTSGESLDDLATRARESDIDLGSRRDAAVPEVTEVDQVFEPQRLAAKAVQKVVAEHQGEVRYCYERLTRGTNASGEVSVRFTIQPRGHVSVVAVSAPGVGSRSLEKCITQRVKKWRFPQADLETEVEIPFVFSTAGTTLK